MFGRQTNSSDARHLSDNRMALAVALFSFAAMVLLSIGVNPSRPISRFVGALDQRSAEQVNSRAMVRDELFAVASFVFDDCAVTWRRLLSSSRRPYRPARLTLYGESMTTPCGDAQERMSPFYCPVDERVYVDLQLFRRLSAPGITSYGRSAQVYVIAHEFAHHIQALSGTDLMSGPLSHDLLRRIELQADCYAGVWAHSSAQRLLNQNIEDTLRTLGLIFRRPQFEDRSHGTIAQRGQWFGRGMGSGGRLEMCDTFSWNV